MRRKAVREMQTARNVRLKILNGESSFGLGHFLQAKRKQWGGSCQLSRAISLAMLELMECVRTHWGKEAASFV